MLRIRKASTVVLDKEKVEVLNLFASVFTTSPPYIPLEWMGLRAGTG